MVWNNQLGNTKEWCKIIFKDKQNSEVELQIIKNHENNRLKIDIEKNKIIQNMNRLSFLQMLVKVLIESLGAKVNDIETLHVNK